MKKILFAAALLAALSVQAQKSGPALNVPAASRQAFAKAHPGLAGNWEKEGSNFEVNFKEGGKDMSCLIDRAGNITETETVIPPGSLPAPVATAVTKRAKGVKPKELAMIVRPGEPTLYEAEINGKDLLFDANGNLVKTKKDND